MVLSVKGISGMNIQGHLTRYSMLFSGPDLVISDIQSRCISSFASQFLVSSNHSCLALMHAQLTLCTIDPESSMLCINGKLT